MKKLMNVPASFVDDSLEGILTAYPQHLTSCANDIRAIIKSGDSIPGKVAVVTGGGYGHLPVFLGYVGQGLCDGVAVGNVFTSPSCETILNVSRAMDSGAGILYLFGNYVGDGMNFSMASDILTMEGIKTEILTVSDDIASAPRNNWADRRGVAGIIFAYKIAGACASAMNTMAEVKRITAKTIENTATFGVAFSSCILPDVGKPTFLIGNDEMEIGMGIHGEPGIRRGIIQTSKELSIQLTKSVINDLSICRGEQVAVLINGLGATSREELYIFYRDINKLLLQEGIIVKKVLVDEFATSLEMAGASLTLLRLDEEIEAYLNAPAITPFVNFNF